jgi:hypothetical protein
MSDDQASVSAPRRTTVLSAVAVTAVAVLGGGAYAAYSFLAGGGPHPEDVLPASTIGVVSVDLDPSAGQKISAIRSMRKFPALKDTLGLHADDDLRKYAVDKLLEQTDCPGVDFAADVEPWLGKRAGFGAVDLDGGDPVPAIALQVDDTAKAETGFAALVDCAGGDDLGFAVGKDYLIASDTTAHAEAILDEGTRHPLADDPGYRRWTGAVGDAGVVSFYVSHAAARYFRDLVDEFGAGVGGPFTPGGGTAGAGVSPRAADPFQAFQGLAGTVRFADGGMELALATGGTKDLSGGAPVGPRLARLPEDTAVALGLGVPEDFARTVVDQLGGVLDDSSGSFADEIESQTGLDLPRDLQVLLGDSVTFSLGGKAPADLDAVQQPDEVPAGVTIHGDADRIRAVIAKVEDHLGTRLADVPLVLDASGDTVVIATSQDYADRLLAPGGLGSTARFRSAVPESDRASGVLYLDARSRWRDAIADLVSGVAGDAAGRRFDENTRPLTSIGVSTWNDAGVTHSLLKLATD